jgi:hypothetical protein
MFMELAQKNPNFEKKKNWTQVQIFNNVNKFIYSKKVDK